jgi:spore coat protein H
MSATANPSAHVARETGVMATSHFQQSEPCMQELTSRTRPLRALFWFTFFLILSALPACRKSAPDVSDLKQGESSEPAAQIQTINLATAKQSDAREPATDSRKPEQKGTGDFFSRGEIPLVRITAAPDACQQLESDPRTFVRVDVQIDGVIYRDVGLHMKGRGGSFRSLNSKPGFTLKFNKFSKGQRFQGLEKIHLNNAVQDPSFMTEILYGQMFRDAGVPAARATNARVELNGRRLGFYVLVEGITEDFLGRYFKNTEGNLYDFPYAHDVTSAAAKESKDRDPADLRALAAAAKEPDLAKRWEHLGRVLDLNRFITYLAIEVSIWDWDCYAMCRNNYRVYHDPVTDKIVFMPHGMDQIFDNPRGSILPVMKGLVAKAVLETTEGRRQYFEQMKRFTENEFTEERLTRKVLELQHRIRPVLAELNPNAVRKHDQAVIRLRQHIEQRILSVQKQVARPPEKPVRSSHFP